MTDRDLMQQALDALEIAEVDGNCYYEATELLRKRLAQPEQEPVAWMYQCTADNSRPVLLQQKQNWAESGTGLWVESPLYTTPPAAQQEPLGPEPFGYFQYSIRLDAWVQNRINNKGVAFYIKENT
jgi:hypothetical protein